MLYCKSCTIIWLTVAVIRSQRVLQAVFIHYTVHTVKMQGYSGEGTAALYRERTPPMKKQTVSLRLLLILTVTALLLLLIPMLMLGRYAVMSADDFGYSGTAHLAWKATDSVLAAVKAAWIETAETWYGWQGTFSAIFLMSMQPALFGESFYALTPALLLSALLLGVFTLCLSLFGEVFHADLRIAGITAAAVCALCSQIPPSPVQAFYWFNGGVYYVFFHGMAMASVALAIRLVRRGGWGRSVLLCLLCVLLGGGNFVTALSCALLGVGGLGLLYLLKTPGRARLLLPVLILLAAFAVSIAAPGNANRQATVSGGAGVVRSVLLSFRCGLRYPLQWLSLPLFGTLLFLLPLLYRAAAEVDFAFRFPGAVTVLSYCFLSAMFCPPIYAMGNTGDLRLINIIFFTFVLLLTLNLFYWLGWAAEKELLSKRPGPSVSAVLVLSGALTLSYLAGAATGHGITSLGAIGLMRSGEAQAFRACADRRLKVLEDDSIRDALLEPFPSQPYLLYFDDISEDPESGNNICMSIYYGKDSLRIAPPA